MTSTIDILKNGLAGEGGIIQKGQNIAENLLDKAKLPFLNQPAKDTLKDIGRAAISQIPQSWNMTPTGSTGPAGKPTAAGPMSKPVAEQPMEKPKTLSGWDKFKNFFAGVSNKVLAPMGVPEAHIIKPEDYIKDPKTGKDVFSWDKANENFKRDNGRARTGVDVGKIVSTATKYIR